MNKTTCKIAVTADTIMYSGTQSLRNAVDKSERLTIVAHNNREETSGMDSTPEVHYSVTNARPFTRNESGSASQYAPLFPEHLRSKNNEQDGGQLWEAGMFSMAEPDTRVVIAQRLEVVVSAEHVELLRYKCAEGFDVLEVRMSAVNNWHEACDQNPDAIQMMPVKPMVKACFAPVQPSDTSDSLPNTPIRK